MSRPYPSRPYAPQQPGSPLRQSAHRVGGPGHARLRRGDRVQAQTRDGAGTLQQLDLDQTRRGDVVEVVNAVVGPKLSDPGAADCNDPFAQWPNA